MRARVGEGMLEGGRRGLRWRVVGGWVDLQGQTNSRGCLLAACWVAFGFFGTSFFQLGLFELGRWLFSGWQGQGVGCAVGQSRTLGVSGCIGLSPILVLGGVCGGSRLTVLAFFLHLDDYGSSSRDGMLVQYM